MLCAPKLFLSFAPILIHREAWPNLVFLIPLIAVIFSSSILNCDPVLKKQRIFDPQDDVLPDTRHFSIFLLFYQSGFGCLLRNVKDTPK